MAEAALPSPLTPSDCDLSSYGWFQFHHRRLRASSFWKRASDTAKAVSVDFWCEAWEQVPAASIPDDDHVLSDWAGYGRRDLSAWLAVKAEVLSAWVLCSDGRWYHPTLSEVARQAWEERQVRELRREGERVRKEAYRASKAEGVSRGTSADVPRDVRSCPAGKRSERRGEDRRREETQDADASSVVSAEPKPTETGPGEVKDLLAKPAESVTSPAASRPKPWLRDAHFGQAWEACTADMRGRSASREKTWPLWARAAIAAGGPERLAAAVKAYVAGDKDIARTGGPAFDRWLRDGKWQHWLDVANAAGPAPAWCGPADLRAAVAALKSPEWCVSYLDRCDWRDIPDRALVPPNSFAARVIAAEIGDFLRDRSIQIIQREAA